MNSDSKSKGHSKNFSEKEDNLLVSVWLNVGQDPVYGNQIKMQLSEKKVEKYYHEHMTFDYDRNLSSLKHRLGETKYLISVAPLSYGDSI
jgi:hypothetical protein